MSGIAMRNQHGRTVYNEINSPCPNPRCTKKRVNHTNEEVAECKRTAMADA